MPAIRREDMPDTVDECKERVLDPKDVFICDNKDSDIYGKECGNPDRFPEGCPYYVQNAPIGFRFVSKYGEPH